jgi:CheY-like chemotaxis protein
MATILVVDDNTDMRQIMRDMLVALGHRVVDAPDGLEGVRLALANEPDLILLDLMMPIVAGTSMLQIKHSIPAIAMIPVLVISAHSDASSIARDYGADAWLAKPVRIADLQRMINTMLPKAENPSQFDS